MAGTHHEVAFFSGRVQGVGFRYAAFELAREYEVAGFVTNLPDGRVHVEAEGTSEEVDAFIAAVEERMHGFVRKVERSSTKREALFSGFAIR
jgi:acylphosphatase